MKHPPNKPLMVLLGLLLTARTMAGDAPATAAVVRDFDSDEFRFRLKYPADWILPEHPVHDQVFSLQTPPLTSNDPKDTRFGVVGLRIADGPEGHSDHDILMEVSADMAAYVFNNGGKKVTLKPDQLAGVAARRVRFISEQPSGTIETIYVIAVRHRVEYVFNVAAPAEKFEDILPKVEALFKSFEVLD